MPAQVATPGLTVVSQESGSWAGRIGRLLPDLAELKALQCPGGVLNISPLSPSTCPACPSHPSVLLSHPCSQAPPSTLSHPPWPLRPGAPQPQAWCRACPVPAHLTFWGGAGGWRR